MKLLYHESNNVGDFINEIIFDEIRSLPVPESHIALGIGTILGLKTPLEKTTYHVFGSGLSSDQIDTYGTFDSSKIHQYVFHGVRGPLTANAIDSDSPPKISGDFAYLLTTKIQPTRTESAQNIGFVPHKDSLQFYGFWEQLLQNANIKLISPLLPPQEFIDGLSGCSKVMCEAMHGAILCDAYGIPWLPVFTYPGISHSKWNDWLGSMGHQNVNFLYLRGPRNNKWKKHILAQYLGNSIAEIVSARYEKLMAQVFLKKLLSISAKSNFLLSDRAMVSRTISLQNNIIRSFLADFEKT